MQPIEVWTWLEDGVPRGFFTSEHSLLISYDMMPLRGLEATQEVLNRDGKIAKGAFVPSEDGFFVPVFNGNIDPASLEWGCCGLSDYEKSYRNLCFFLGQKRASSEDEQKKLMAFYWYACKQKRDTKKKQELKNACDKIMASKHCQLIRVRFVVN